VTVSSGPAAERRPGNPGEGDALRTVGVS
jgi:hypothetical protein